MSKKKKNKKRSKILKQRNRDNRRDKKPKHSTQTNKPAQSETISAQENLEKCIEDLEQEDLMQLGLAISTARSKIENYERDYPYADLSTYYLAIDNAKGIHQQRRFAQYYVKFINNIAQEIVRDMGHKKKQNIIFQEQLASQDKWKSEEARPHYLSLKADPGELEQNLSELEKIASNPAVGKYVKPEFIALKKSLKKTLRKYQSGIEGEISIIVKEYEDTIAGLNRLNTYPRRHHVVKASERLIFLRNKANRDQLAAWVQYLDIDDTSNIPELPELDHYEAREYYQGKELNYNIFKLVAKEFDEYGSKIRLVIQNLQNRDWSNPDSSEKLFVNMQHELIMSSQSAKKWLGILKQGIQKGEIHKLYAAVNADYEYLTFLEQNALDSIVKAEAISKEGKINTVRSTIGDINLTDEDYPSELMMVREKYLTGIDSDETKALDETVEALIRLQPAISSIPDVDIYFIHESEEVTKYGRAISQYEKAITDLKVQAGYLADYHEPTKNLISSHKSHAERLKKEFNTVLSKYVSEKLQNLTSSLDHLDGISVEDCSTSYAYSVLEQLGNRIDTCVFLRDNEFSADIFENQAHDFPDFEKTAVAYNILDASSLKEEIEYAKKMQNKVDHLFKINYTTEFIINNKNKVQEIREALK